MEKSKKRDVDKAGITEKSTEKGKEGKVGISKGLKSVNNENNAGIVQSKRRKAERSSELINKGIKELNNGARALLRRFCFETHSTEARQGLVGHFCCEIPLRTGCFLIGFLSLPLPILDIIMIPLRYISGPSWENYNDGGGGCPVSWKEVGYASTYVLHLHWGFAIIHVICMCSLTGLAATLVVGTFYEDGKLVGAAKLGAALVFLPVWLYFLTEWGVARIYRVNIYVMSLLLLSPALWTYLLIVIDGYHQQLLSRGSPTGLVEV